MLRFSLRPDRCFLEILLSSLEIAIDVTHERILTGAQDPDWFREDEPLLARYFTPQQYAEILESLRRANGDPRVFQITDYHWLAIYVCLESFCAVHNDVARESPDRVLPVGPYLIGEIDFDEVVEDYFWDTDFLTTPDLLDMSPEERSNFDFSDQAWAIAAGMRPHPDDLRIEVTNRPVPDHRDGDPYPASGVIRRYPDDADAS